jgi:peptidoglycan hydrolase-like protein with peptidoglycan-binding domain
MQKFRCRQWVLWCILVLLMVTIIPLPAQASSYGTQDLTLGSRGEAVSQLQKDLTQLGFYSSSIDGWFGPKTHDAVVSFQKSKGLKMDGVVGPITKKALSNALSSYGTQDLTLGSRGEAVSQLQKDLTQLGFYSGSIDGWFGPKTHDAVVSFQKSKGLKIDGVVGPITKKALSNALTGKVSSPPLSSSAQLPTAASISHYNSHEKPLVDSFRAKFDGSLAQTLVGRAIWYMEYGYMKYGHTKYAATGYIDCSNFVSLVYKDFGYSITSASKNYGSVGVKVAGVYAEKIPGTSKYTLVGIEKLKPGDIFTFWNSSKPARTHIGHVAIYMGVINGNPCIINTCKGNPTAIGIINSFSYWYGENLIEVRRVLPASAFTAGSKINDNGPVIPALYQIKPDKPIVMPKDLPAGF